MPPTVRRLVAALVMVCAVVGLGTPTAPLADRSAVDTPSIDGGTARRAPLDGVAPGAPVRVGDLAQSGRTRVRWIGDVLVALALVALWFGAAPWWLVDVGDRLRRDRAQTRPALGRAPPVALIPR